jgi:Wax ester synthase/diacylglycerol acyltransferase catalytic domain
MSEGAMGSAPVPLSAADRAILAMEGPTIAGHTCKVIRVGTPAPSVAALAAAVAARLPLVPALTWKLAGPLDAACWRADPAVDLQAHIAQVACDGRPDDAALGRGGGAAVPPTPGPGPPALAHRRDRPAHRRRHRALRLYSDRVAHQVS